MDDVLIIIELVCASLYAITCLGSNFFSTRAFGFLLTKLALLLPASETCARCPFYGLAVSGLLQLPNLLLEF